MDNNCILEFLTELKKNNALDWMHTHKNWYKEASFQFEQLVQEFVLDLSAADKTIPCLQAKDLTFRLNRDTRFSHDKSPYNPAFRAHIAPNGKMPVPVGYFLHISPGASFLGGGLFASQFSDATTCIRDYISSHGETFENILNETSFKDNFVLIGEQLKNVPKGYEKDKSYSNYLKYKSLAIEYHIPDEALKNLAVFEKQCVEKFLLMKPFNSFINNALKDFKMPERRPK